MLDVGWSEMALILLVALIVIGPRDLPRVARTVGKWVAKGRGMAREFQHAIEDMAREAELDKIKSEIEKAGRTDVGKTIENTIDPTGELGQAFDPTAKSRAKPNEPASARPADAGAPAAPVAQPAAAEAAKAKPGNGQAADLQPEPPVAGSRSGSKAPERETAPADPS